MQIGCDAEKLQINNSENWIFLIITELVGEIRCLGLISIVARTGIWKFYHCMWVKWLKQESGNLTS
jgi:hypothetical protein